MKAKKTKKWVFLAFLAILLTPLSSFALGALDDAQVKSAFASGVTSLEVVTTGVISLGATLTALGIVFGWLKK